MPKRLTRPRDPVQLGKLIGDILTGQVEDNQPTTPDDPNKDPAAVAWPTIGSNAPCLYDVAFCWIATGMRTSAVTHLGGRIGTFRG
jgi:hypothetical protein